MTPEASGDGATADVLLRPLQWQDIPELVSMDLEAFPYDAWSAETFWSELARVPQAAFYVVATRGRRLDGYAGIAYIDSDAHLQTLAVSPNSQRSGLGRQLLSVVLAEAIRHGASRCLLEVKIDNLPAIALYTSVGFTELGTRPGYYPGGETALVLVRDFEEAS